MVVLYLEAFMIPMTPAKLAPSNLGSQGHLRSENDAITSCLRLISNVTTSYIHIRHIQSVWAIGMLSQRHMDAPLYRDTGQVGPSRFGKSGPLVEWNWCYNVMFEADIHLRSLQTSILDTHKIIDPLGCCLKEIWMHPYTVTLAMMAPSDLVSQGHLWSDNDAISSCLRLIPTSDHFIYP